MLSEREYSRSGALGRLMVGGKCNLSGGSESTEQQFERIGRIEQPQLTTSRHTRRGITEKSK